MKSLQYFLGPLEVEHLNKDVQKFPLQAYAVDKPCGEEGIRLKDQFKMGSFHSCDYILAEENRDKVLLIEDSNLRRAKEDLENKLFRFMQDDDQARKILHRKIVEKIRDENRLKAYASLLLLCCLVSKDADAKNLIEGKEIHFWVIVTDGVASDFRVFDEIGSSLTGSLKPFVSGVELIPLKEAEQKLNEWA